MFQKRDRIFLWFLKKRKPTKKKKNKLNLGTEVDEPKTSSSVKLRM